MIKREDLAKIGQFGKPHGVKGEITFTFTDRSFENSECPFFICEIDGIFVPFRIENYRLISDAAGMVCLKNLHSDNQVCLLSRKDIYFPKKHLAAHHSNSAYTWDYFIGFTVIDKYHGQIGRIAGVDDSTLNTLFIVETKTQEILIPAADEMIVSFDERKKELSVALPDGLMEMACDDL
ncbi:MAG: ribosome maturation factor RimM [Dysgonamonadaceae bacterium]|jgi:16S rRNA processing protein RimM|nr:ribosome maturation factor RimM [Dysgonamonadaceae bacterium]